jgi:type VI protein secretion system component VasF
MERFLQDWYIRYTEASSGERFLVSIGTIGRSRCLEQDDSRHGRISQREKYQVLNQVDGNSARVNSTSSTLHSTSTSPIKQIYIMAGFVLGTGSGVLASAMVYYTLSTSLHRETAEVQHQYVFSSLFLRFPN